MEFIIIDDQRVEIPAAVIAASTQRELVEDYIHASPEDREHIHQLAREELGEVSPTPPSVVVDTPTASTDATDAPVDDAAIDPES